MEIVVVFYFTYFFLLFFSFSFLFDSPFFTTVSLDLLLGLWPLRVLEVASTVCFRPMFWMEVVELDGTRWDERDEMR